MVPSLRDSRPKRGRSNLRSVIASSSPGLHPRNDDVVGIAPATPGMLPRNGIGVTASSGMRPVHDGSGRFTRLLAPAAMH